VLKGWLVITLGFLVFSLVVKEEGYPDVVKAAYTLPAVQRSANAIRVIMPEDIGEIFQLDDDDSGDITLQPDTTPTDSSADDSESPTTIPSDLEELEQMLNETDTKN
jgi:hypothetical protein